ncbi:HDOD domain-containing protein [bacterium]|nr:HDOD domain-containing protein [bacterium]
MNDLVTRVPLYAWDQLDESIRSVWDARMNQLLPAPPLLSELSGPHLTLEDFDARALADKVGHDAVLGSRILAVANSARFGLRQPMTSIQRAMVHLGFNLVKSIIVAYLLESGFSKAPPIQSKHMEFVRHWTAGASVLAFRWGQDAALADPSTASTLALISRLGSLLLGSADPRPTDAYRQLSLETDRLHLEMDTWQVITPVLSAELAHRWNIPHPVPSLLSHLWMPVGKVVPPDPLDPHPRMLTLVAASLVIAQACIVSGADLVPEPEQVIGREGNEFLLHNINEHKLNVSLTTAWSNARVRREFDSVIS